MRERRRWLAPKLLPFAVGFVGLTLLWRKKPLDGRILSTWQGLVGLRQHFYHRYQTYHKWSHRSDTHDAIHDQSSSTSSFRRRLVKDEQKSSSSSQSICSLLPTGRSAYSIWRQNMEHIFKASIHPNDQNATHGPWIRKLLQLLPPHILQRAIRVNPQLQDGSPWDLVMTKIFRKLQHVNDSTVPPVQIAVFGGSVTEGRDCNVLPKEVGITREEADATTPHRIIGRGCSWPHRLQQLLDAALGKSGIVFVTNLAVGGTNSYLSLPIIQNWLYPEHLPLLDGGGVDVIINAYATNDNLPLWNRPRNTTVDRYHTDTKWYMIQSFLQTCKLSQPCQDTPPLVLYFDDYVGNQGNVILGEMQVHDATQEIGRYGDGNMGHVSSIDAFWRPFVLTNTSETLLSPKWKGDHVEVHFGMPGHAARTWIFAYALLQWTVDYCQDRAANGSHHNVHSKLSAASTFKTTSTASATSLDAQVKLVYDAERHRIQKRSIPRPPRPDASYVIKQNAHMLSRTFETLPLSVGVRLLNVTKDWTNTVQNGLATRVEQCETSDPQSTTVTARTRPCTFAFIAAPMGTHVNAKDLNMYVARYASVNNNWLAQDDIKNGWQNKLGYVAQKPDARLVLHLPNITTPIKVVTLYYLKSYGEKWQGSTANFTLSIHRRHKDGAETYKQDETTWQLVGYHNQETSISYPHTVDFGRDYQALPGDSVSLKIELVGGSTFKILALLLCNR